MTRPSELSRETGFSSLGNAGRSCEFQLTRPDWGTPLMQMFLRTNQRLTKIRHVGNSFYILNRDPSKAGFVRCINDRLPTDALFI